MADFEHSNGNSAGRPRQLQEKQWVRKVREQGDRDAFEKIFRSYYERLCNYAHGYLGTSQGAEDVVQAVFLKIWDQRKNWNPEGTVSQYLFTAVRNKALNVLRHERVKEDTEEEVIRVFQELKDKSSADDEETEELRQAIQNAINDLPPRRREIFLLSRRSGLTYQEIANVLGVSVNTVGTQMGRALKTLRNHLGDWLPLLAVAKLSELVF